MTRKTSDDSKVDTYHPHQFKNQKLDVSVIIVTHSLVLAVRHPWSRSNNCKASFAAKRATLCSKLTCKNKCCNCATGGFQDQFNL